METEVLKEIGLTDGEIRVYLALIELGNSTVGPIIDKSRISSSKVYVILEKLIQKGLATYVIKKKTKYFQANPPDNLLEYLKEKQLKLKSHEKQLNKIILDIKKLTKAARKEDEARIFKGFDGIKIGFFEAIESIPKRGEYLFFSTGYNKIDSMKILFSQIARTLKERKLTIKGIGDKSEKDIYKKYYFKLGYKMRFLDFFWPSDTSIAGDYLLILVYDEKEPVLYSIKSKKLIESYKNFFEKMWNVGIS